MNAETRHLFAYVPQGNTILSGTIAENMRMVKEDATDEEIIEALKISCAWDLFSICRTPSTAASGKRGRGFSEGQSQRLAIARAVLRDAPVLLLDEATSALDVTTERNVLRNIIRQRPNKTCIVTTHRPSVLSLCQRVYRVMNGTVTELDGAEGAKMVEEFLTEKESTKKDTKVGRVILQSQISYRVVSQNPAIIQPSKVTQHDT